MGISALNCKEIDECCNCNKKHNKNENWRNVTPEEYILSFGQDEKTNQNICPKDKKIFELDFSRFSDSGSDEETEQILDNYTNMKAPIEL